MINGSVFSNKDIGFNFAVSVVGDDYSPLSEAEVEEMD